MSEFFNKMMYGDGDKKDFSPKDLSLTMAQVHKRLIRVHGFDRYVTAVLDNPFAVTKRLFLAVDSTKIKINEKHSIK